MKNGQRDYLIPIRTCLKRGWEIRSAMCTNPHNDRTQFWWIVLPCIEGEFHEDCEGYGLTPRTALARAEANIKEDLL